MSETIAAVATPPGAGGIAIVRLSGDVARSIADRVIKSRGDPPSKRSGGTFFHATLIDPDSGKRIDDVVVLVFSSPQSYTGEDVIEFQGHGGTVNAQRMLRATLRAGAVMAHPGEFTRRAYENGKLDLVQAEAVVDLIQAHSERAAGIADRQLAGSLSEHFKIIYSQICDVQTDIEALLDIEDAVYLDLRNTRSELARALRSVRGLLSTQREGQYLREGALVVIAGPPNAGKSTLLNALLDQSRAIVSPVPGTTRDTIEATMVLEGIALTLVDTAGLREVSDGIESEGVLRSRKAMQNADLILYVIDATRPWHKNVSDELMRCDPRNCLLVVNKNDLIRGQGASLFEAWMCSTAAKEKNLLASYESVPVSALTGAGMGELRRALGRRLHAHYDRSIDVAIGTRHACALEIVVRSIRRTAKFLGVGTQRDEVLAAENLRPALEALAEILGRGAREDVIERIFSRFCVGK